MSKYNPLWAYIKENGSNQIKLTFSDIEEILTFPIDHSFLNFKKELTQFGYEVGKISLKENHITFNKIVN